MPTSSRKSPEPVLVVRADGSAAIGLGHLMRMRAVAQAAQERSVRVVFATRADRSVLGAYDGPLLALPPELPPSQEPSWLAQALPRRGFVLLDGYSFDRAMLQALRTARFRTGLIVDQPGAPEALADLVVNPNLHATATRRQEGQGQIRLSGPAFGLLRREFREARQRPRAETSEPLRLLLTFGGSDVAGLTPRVLEWLHAARNELPPLQITAVLGPAASSWPAAQRWQGPGVQVLGATDRMSEVIGAADLAIAAAGTTVLELACLGVPSLLVTVVDNQDGIAAAAARAGFALDLGRAETLTAAAVIDGLKAFSAEPRRKAAAAAAMSTVDGQGALRVVDEIRSMLPGVQA
jgi:UDP-2,4-diacetamido-2,4,6-trideoxy-beta-L-altropyranose hydrolase